MSMTIKEMNAKAVAELTDVINRIDPVQVDDLIERLAKANRVVVYGVGREGLMLKALAMRLFHMGLDAHVVGDMTTPPVGKGDVLMVSAGPGYFSTVAALMGVAHSGSLNKPLYDRFQSSCQKPCRHPPSSSDAITGVAKVRVNKDTAISLATSCFVNILI